MNICYNSTEVIAEEQKDLGTLFKINKSKALIAQIDLFCFSWQDDFNESKN